MAKKISRIQPRNVNDADVFYLIESQSELIATIRMMASGDLDIERDEIEILMDEYDKVLNGIIDRSSVTFELVEP